MKILVCNNCDWTGWETEAVHPKHVESARLCPECYETTEEMTPRWVKELLSAEELVHLVQRLERAFEPVHEAVTLALKEISNFWEQLPQETKNYIIAFNEAHQQDVTAESLTLKYPITTKLEPN